MRAKRDSTGAFQRLHPLVQRKLYDMRWTELRPVQTETVRAFFAHGRHLILAAGTASGKTEAAFLPILSRMAAEPGGGLRALYVSPLKALINDQFPRLEDLCERLDIPVFKWHGDVAAPPKKKFLSNPQGLLLITPESLESLFINNSEYLSRLFGRLSWTVIDEMHAFAGTERGVHLLSLLARVDRRAARLPRRIALSATLGDFETAKKWLAPPSDPSISEIEVIAPEDDGKGILYRIKGYETGADLSVCITDMIRLFSDTSLVFVNSKTMLEHLANSVKRRVEKQRLPDRYRVHHGSLSKAEREDTEDALKSRAGTVTLCSSTLELGIDVGNVTRVGQFGAPWSVNSLRQRLGRSGRKDEENSALAMFIVDYNPDADVSFVDTLHPGLLQAVAMSELMFEGWSESPDIDLPHYSTLVQQCLSVLAEKGGVSASELYEILVVRGAFQGISRAIFAEILLALGGHDLIEQTAREDLILGLAGERIVRGRDFYAVFTAPQQITVVHEGQPIGSIFLALDMIPEGFILLAGRRWKMRGIDLEKNVITVVPAEGGKAPPFGGDEGPEIHARVRRKMLEVLSGNNIPRYLDEGAAKMLSDARLAAAAGGIATGAPLARKERNLFWFPWESSAVHRTLYAMGVLAGTDPEDRGIALEFVRMTPEELLEAYSPFLSAPPESERILEVFQLAGKGREKYDRFLPPSFLLETFEKSRLDIRVALAAVEALPT